MGFKHLSRTFFGGCRVGTLWAGKPAPPISLSSVDGEKLTLAEALKKGPVLVAFFKVNCPTCQYTLPFLQRIYEMGGSANFTVWAISQNDAEDTRDFLREYGVRFPALLDGPGYPASNQYGLTNVPSIFLIAPDGKIQMASVGFSKVDLERIAAEVSRATGQPSAALFKPAEVVPDYKPG
jgi:peroxiredoxin